MTDRHPPADRQDLPFHLDDVELSNGEAAVRGMVMTPRAPMVITRDRLARLAQTSTVNEVERGLIAEVRKRKARIVMFQAADDAGTRLWQFDPTLGDDDLSDAGQTMCRALLPLHRRFVAAGVMLMVHTEWEVRECFAMREGIARLEAVRAKEADACSELDAWLLQNMLLHVSLAMQHVIDTLLPTHLTMIERRISRVNALLADVPKHAID